MDTELLMKVMQETAQRDQKRVTAFEKSENMVHFFPSEGKKISQKRRGKEHGSKMDSGTAESH